MPWRSPGLFVSVDCSGRRAAASQAQRAIRRRRSRRAPPIAPNPAISIIQLDGSGTGPTSPPLLVPPLDVELVDVLVLDGVGSPLDVDVVLPVDPVLLVDVLVLDGVGSPEEVELVLLVELLVLDVDVDDGRGSSCPPIDGLGPGTTGDGKKPLDPPPITGLTAKAVCVGGGGAPAIRKAAGGAGAASNAATGALNKFASGASAPAARQGFAKCVASRSARSIAATVVRAGWAAAVSALGPASEPKIARSVCVPIASTPMAAPNSSAKPVRVRRDAVMAD